jgi:hypothetical protein
MASAAQRSEVVRLAAEGVSVRAIAAQVFGEARFRGRVERILREPSALGPVEPVGLADLSGLSPAETLSVLYDRRIAYLNGLPDGPSMAELCKVADMLRRLIGLRSYERLLAQARKP